MTRNSDMISGPLTQNAPETLPGFVSFPLHCKSTRCKHAIIVLVLKYIPFDINLRLNSYVITKVGMILQYPTATG